jgi:hypothetical protein
MRQNVLAICTHEQRQAVAEGLRLMHDGSFFAAHEQFEDVWRSADPGLRDLFQGLAQLAAAHHQLTLGRGRAAIRTWQKARARLDRAEILSVDFCCAMDAMYARLGLTIEGPRFVDAQVALAQGVPRLALDTL